MCNTKTSKVISRTDPMIDAMKSTIRFKALQSLRGFQFLSKVVKFY